MSWDTFFPPGVSLSPLQLVGLVAASVRRLRERARRRVEVEPAHEDDAPAQTEPQTLESLDDDEILKGVFSSRAQEPDLDEIPSFTSLPHAGERAGRGEAVASPPAGASPGDVSSLLFRLLGTKARILELERAEKTKSTVLASTCEALQSLKSSLEEPSSELHAEIDEMHELISGELSASRQSSESVRQLKEIIDAQYELLSKPGAVYSADLLLAKRSYVETIDASLDRRLKNAERRETEFALGKERIMALKKQMLKLKDSEPDSTRAH